MINRLIHWRRLRDAIRPTPPTASRQWLGVLAIIVLLFAVDRYSTYFHMVEMAGDIYLLALVLVACWSGLWSALAGSLITVSYVWLVYHFPVSAFGREPNHAQSALISAAIVYPLCALIAGIVQIKLRTAATRVFDATAAIQTEAEQRRIAEAELWSSEEMRKLIISSSADAIVGMSSEGVITLWNRNAERIFGWSRDESIGQLASKRIVSVRNSDRLKADLRRFLETGKNPVLRNQIELVVKSKARNEVPIEVYIADHTTSSGSIYILFARDITDHKRAEAAVHELNNRLEERVAERTKQLEEANEEMLRFTYSVSHDLRAPLRAIVSNSRLLCEETKDSLSETSKGRIKRLEVNALKMAELIDNLLHYIRVGQVALSIQEINLSAMANEIADDLRASGKGRIAVQRDMRAEGDPEMIKMVMFNLMENAWKYVQAGKYPSIDVGVTADGVFFVRDHGIGFEMKYANKIWEPFERLHRDSDYPGTGIGLANSRRVIMRHGGRIWAESVPGQGTTMYFNLGAAAGSESRELALK